MYTISNSVWSWLTVLSIRCSWIHEMLQWMKINSTAQFNLHYILVFISWISPHSQMLHILVGIFLVANYRTPTQISINSKWDLLAHISEKSRHVLIKAVSQFSVILLAMPSSLYSGFIPRLASIIFTKWLSVATRATCYLIHI